MSGEGEARARSLTMEAGGLKKKVASASEVGDSLVDSLSTKPTAAEALRPGAKGKRKKKVVKKGKEPRVSKDVRKKPSSAPERFDILKKKKLMMAYRAVLDAHLADAGEEIQPAEAGKKRMKVVMKKLPQEVINAMMSNPLEHLETPQDQLKNRPQETSRYYNWRNAMVDYQKALINHFKAHGNAEDVVEVTDDEDGAKACDRGLKREEVEGFDILKKKKVMMGYMAVLNAHLSEETKKMMEELQPAKTKKKMKVVKKRLPKGLIDVMMAKPIDQVSEEHLGYRFLQSRIYFDWKNAVAEYEKALINQYKAHGYVEDEMEVTDDEEMVES